MKKLRSLQMKYNKLKKEEQKIYKLSNKIFHYTDSSTGNY